jgi:hypothetical protein
MMWVGEQIRRREKGRRRRRRRRLGEAKVVFSGDLTSFPCLIDSI